MIGDEIFQYGEKIEWIGHIKSVPRMPPEGRHSNDSVNSVKGDSQVYVSGTISDSP